MRFFGCDGCDARKETIEVIQAELTAKNNQIETLTKRLTEIADPGIDRRLRQPRPIKGPLPGPVGPRPLRDVTLHDEPGANFPGYERARVVGPPIDYEVD